MALRLTNQADAAVMIDRLNNVLGTNEKREVTIDSINDLDTCSEILATCIGFSNQVIERQRYAMTRQAVLDVKRKRRLDVNAILGIIEERQKDYLRQPNRNFVLLTSASFRFWSKLRAIKLNDCILEFSPNRPKNYPLPDGGSLIVKDNTPPYYCYIKVRVSARDPYQAADLAFQRLDLLRAVWNLHLNLRSSFRMTLGSSGHKPVNRILPGPFHTVHFPDGELALTGEWLYTLLAKDSTAESIEHYYGSLQRFQRFVQKRISVSTFPNELASLLVRYAQALDESDMSTSFLRLWALLEEITGTTKDSYAVTVNRASFVFKDSGYARVVLGYLRDQRNRIVHKGVTLDNVERLTYELKAFVEALLQFALANSKTFQDLQDFHSLLSLPRDPNLLRKRMKQHKLASRLHERSHQTRQGSRQDEAD